MGFKIGFGYDVHALAKGETLWLGGVEIEHSLGTVAHSDGDVALHAISDALLGAAGLRDIGFHFPDTSAEFKNADSKVLLAEVVRLIDKEGYKIGNIDCTICAQQPKLLPHIPKMQETIAAILRVSVKEASVKATTTEKLGFVGSEQGIAVHAVALIESK